MPTDSVPNRQERIVGGKPQEARKPVSQSERPAGGPSIMEVRYAATDDELGEL